MTWCSEGLKLIDTSWYYQAALNTPQQRQIYNESVHRNVEEWHLSARAWRDRGHHRDSTGLRLQCLLSNFGALLFSKSVRQLSKLFSRSHISQESRFCYMQMQWKLAVVLVIACLFMILEFAGGLIANRCLHLCTRILPPAFYCRVLRQSGWKSVPVHQCDVALCSVAIMTDAAHLLSDTTGFAMALAVSFYASRRSMSTHTFGYGVLRAALACKCFNGKRRVDFASVMPNTEVFCRYHRMEVLGALVSVLLTWLVTGMLLWEAVNRIVDPHPINGKRECFASPANPCMAEYFIVGCILID